MEYSFILLLIAAAYFLFFRTARLPYEDIENQRLFDEQSENTPSKADLGKSYERYIGYLYESGGYDVTYNGAINGAQDMGIDLIIKNGKDISLLQTKYWAKFKFIHEKHIFQLYGSMVHYNLTSKKKGYTIKAIFCTSAQYSDTAIKVARELGVELKTQKYDRSYPKIKCNVSEKGLKIYHLPFDPYYDKVKIDPRKGEFFVKTVKEAVAKGFRKARNQTKAA